MLNLPVGHDQRYWKWVREIAQDLKSDGCSAIPYLSNEFFEDCCFEHDIHYRTGKTIFGDPITRAQADQRLRECIQIRSDLGKLDPLAWWRWAAVRLFGGGAWHGQ